LNELLDVTVLLLNVLIWNLLPSVALAPNCPAESAEQFMSVNTHIWGNLLNGILERSPNFRAEVINDLFHFDGCH
jgi:hypothetical protein